MTELDDLLDRYGLDRDTVTAYIDAIVRSNQTETAEELQVSRDTVNRYKNAFHEMTQEERAFVIAAVFDERHRAVLRETD